MNTVMDHVTTTAEVRAHSGAPRHPIRIAGGLPQEGISHGKRVVERGEPIEAR